MKQLLLLRHAKAVPGEGQMADRDRPLAERGERDARAMGAAIAKRFPPQRILSSPSLRTRQTMAGIIAESGPPPEQTIVEILYGGDSTAYLTTIADDGGDAGCVMVIGHNPTVHLLALELAPTGSGQLAKFPTCALAAISFDVADWSAVRRGRGKLDLFLRPKDLGAGGDD